MFDAFVILWAKRPSSGAPKLEGHQKLTQASKPSNASDIYLKLPTRVFTFPLVIYPIPPFFLFEL
jgi:hypothetical protein